MIMDLSKQWSNRMKLNMKTKMIIGATLCALALSANADGSCALAKRDTSSTTGVGKDADVWVGFVCEAKSDVVENSTSKNGVWVMIKPGSTESPTAANCSGSVTAYTYSHTLSAEKSARKGAEVTVTSTLESTGVALKTWSTDRVVFGETNNGNICVGVLG
jgi:hypothetical protein